MSAATQHCNYHQGSSKLFFFFVNGCIRAFVYLYLLTQTLVFVIVLFVDGCMSVHYFVRLAFGGYSSCEVQGLAHIRC